MRSGKHWFRTKWVDSSHKHIWRASLIRLRLVRDPWTSRVDADFAYVVEFSDESKEDWTVREANTR